MSTYQGAQSLAQIIARAQEAEQGAQGVGATKRSSSSMMHQVRVSEQQQHKNLPAIIQLTQAEVTRTMQGLCLCCRMHAELSHLLREAFMQALQKKRVPFSHIIVCARSDTDPANIVHTLNNDFFLKERYVFWDVVTCLRGVDLPGLVEQMDSQEQWSVGLKISQVSEQDERGVGQMNTGRISAGQVATGQINLEQKDAEKSKLPTDLEQAEKYVNQNMREELRLSQLFATDLFLLDRDDESVDTERLMNVFVDSLQGMQMDAAVWLRPYAYLSQDFDQLAYQEYTTDLLAREQSQQRIAHRPETRRLFGAGLIS
ncbi:MAG: hypothetical protein Q4G54_05845 [Pelistega sp.]|nr:hypothetical protein [Pelistega sp.]